MGGRLAPAGASLIPRDHPRRDLLLFVGATVCIGFGQSVYESVFNNFLNETWRITDLQRSFLELPRELPGFLVVFVSAAFFFICNRTLAAVSQLATTIGALLLGFVAGGYDAMLVSLFVLSVGQHLFIPLSSDIGMELSRSGKVGTTLGRLQGAANLAAIAGSLAVYAGFRWLGLTFRGSFVLAAVSFLSAAFLLRGMRRNRPQSAKSRFTLRREYRRYYWMTVLYGTRKQIFLTFGPWVLVTVFHRDVTTIATLLTIGGVVGIGFKPLLGRWIDRFGERVILTAEGLALIAVCLGYGLSERLFPARVAFGVVAVCYLADNLLMSVGMARATWLRKIAVTPADVTPTLTMGVTIDHVFSIGVALLGGVVWKLFGYQYLFLMAAALACVSALVATGIVVPHRHEEALVPPDAMHD